MPRLLLALVVLLVALFARAEAWARVDAPSFTPADSRQGSEVKIALCTYRLTLAKLRAPSGSFPSDRRLASASGNTEVYDMRARQWAPELGTFLSVDEYAFHDARGTLWSWPHQNPIRYSDPSGHDEAFPVAAVILGILGGGATVLTMGAAAPSDSRDAPPDIYAMMAAVPGPALASIFARELAGRIPGLGALVRAPKSPLEAAGEGAICKAPKAGIDPRLKADVEAALSEAKAEAANTTLFHGGELRGGAVQPGPFSTTPSAEHAAQYGAVTEFVVPSDVLASGIENGQVSVFTDSLQGTGSYATEYRFQGDFSTTLNQYRGK